MANSAAIRKWSGIVLAILVLRTSGSVSRGCQVVQHAEPGTTYYFDRHGRQCGYYSSDGGVWRAYALNDVLGEILDNRFPTEADARQYVEQWCKLAGPVQFPDGQT